MGTRLAFVMARKRGAPVLIELMKSGSNSPSENAPQLRFAPIEQIEAKPNVQSGQTLVGGMAMPPRSGKGGPPIGLSWLSQLAKIPLVMWYVILAVLVVSVSGYLLGFTKGKSTKDETDMQRRAKVLLADGPQTAPAIPQPGSEFNGNGGVTTPITPNSSGVATDVGRAANPAANLAVVTPASNEPDAQLQVGMNYLICGVFKRQDDADKSAAFLISKGIPAVIIPAREFSGATSSKDFMVLIKRGYTREKYSVSGLREKVQGLGRLWRAEDRRAPTDFAQPYWDKFK